MDYKRPLVMNDTAQITTWVEILHADGVTVGFEIHKKANGKLSCDGHFHYTMVDLQSGRAAKIPDWIAAKYAI